MQEYHKTIIDKLLKRDQLTIETWSRIIIHIFESDYYTNNEKATVYFGVNHSLGFSGERLRPYRNCGISLNNLVYCKPKKHVIPYYMICQLRYHLAKEYGIVFASSPKTFWVKTEEKETVWITAISLCLA